MTEKLPAVNLPPHLRQDAPHQRCGRCGRKSWDLGEFNTTCHMPQRWNPVEKIWEDPCGGLFKEELLP